MLAQELAVGIGYIGVVFITEVTIIMLQFDTTPMYRPSPDSLLDNGWRVGQSIQAVPVVHGWVPDEEAKECMACKKSFTTIRRRV